VLSIRSADRRAGRDLRRRSRAKTPERISTWSGSWRCVVKRDWPGLRLVEVALDLLGGQRDPRRAAVDHAADRRPVAFAEGGDAEEMAEGIV
jgi:hypothetical protein